MNSKLMWFITAVQMHLLAPREDRERGATATEYALLVALIAIVIAVAVGLFGTNLSTFYNNVATTVSGWSS
jgi:pilus assembly protein Flp/PilA